MIMTYSKNGLNLSAAGYIIAVIYFASNILFYRIPENKFSQPLVSFLIFLFDIIIISLAIYFTDNIATEFYLVYFLAIFISSIAQNIKISFSIAVVASLLYGWLLFRTHPEISFLDPGFLIRIPFLFIISLMSSYWAEYVSVQIRKKEQIEKFNQQLKNEIKKALARETELSKYNEQIINNVTSGIVAVNKDGFIITLNPEAEQTLAISQEETAKYNLKDLDGLSSLWQKIESTIKSGKRVVREEITIRNKKNETLPIGLSTSLISGLNGHPAACIVIFRNLSEIRTLEQKIKQAERLSYLGKVGVWIAHEIRNPLAAIDGFAQLIATKEDGKASPFYVQEIQKNTVRISAIIDDILAFAKTRKAAHTDINLETLIKEILQDLKVKADLSIDHVPVIYGASESVRRVFVNLINNSIDAVDGSGKLSIKSYADKNWVIVEIKDNGKGITPDDMKNLFTPFFTTKTKGTGLGLSIVKKILDEHHGKIEIESELGKGTLTRVYFPINKQK